jgi:hypothetical protein
MGIEYSNRGTSVHKVQQSSRGLVIKKGVWEITTGRGKTKRVVYLDAHQYSTDMVLEAFPKARIKRVQR